MEGIILRDEPSLKLVNSSSLSSFWLLRLLFFFVKIPFFENIKGSKKYGKYEDERYPDSDHISGNSPHGLVTRFAAHHQTQRIKIGN